MEIRKWTTVDVHYKESEIKMAEKQREYLERLGYEFQQTDIGVGEYDYDDQYIKNGKTIVKELKNE
jgi:hypothetical protein